MSWDAVGAISQAVGSLAVFATLVYLAIQVRHARREMQRALSQGRGEAVRSLQFLRVDDAKTLIGAYRKAGAALGEHPNPFIARMIDEVGLDDVEAWMVFSEQVAMWNYRVQTMQYADELSPIDRQAFEAHLRFTFGPPGVGRVFYETFVKTSQHPDAIRYVESVLSKPA